MSFYSKVPERSPQDLWKEISSLDGRLIQTIPYNSSIENMDGFISVMGKEEELPVLSICVQSPTKEKCLVTNIVFSSKDHYNSFLNSLTIDMIKNFSHEELN